MEMTNREFLKEFYKLRSEKLAKTEKELAEHFGFSNIVEMRKTISRILKEEHDLMRKEARELKEAGMTNIEIAEKLGRTESSIRRLLDTE